MATPKQIIDQTEVDNLTQDQVNTEIAKLYAAMLEYVSKNVQSADTFGGLSGNQLVEMESLAKELNIAISKVKGTDTQKFEAMNAIGNEIATMLVSAPNSPYKEYTPQQVNVLAMQSVLGGPKEYQKYAQELNNIVSNLSIEIPFIYDMQNALYDWYGVLNRQQIIDESLRRNPLGDLVDLDILKPDDRKGIDKSFENLQTLKEVSEKQLTAIRILSKNYFNVHRDLNLRHNFAFLAPLIPEAIALSAKVLLYTATACASATGINYTWQWNKELVEDKQRVKADKDLNIKLGYINDFCEKVNDALSVVFEATRKQIQYALSDKNILVADVLAMLQNLKNAQATEDSLSKLISKDTYPDPFNPGQFLEFNFTETCVQGQLEGAGKVINALDNIPSNTSGLKDQEILSKINLVASLFGEGGKIYEIAAENNRKAQEEAREKSGLEDAERRRRAVTHLIEWATYGAVGVGVIWGLSKVYKGYKNDD